MARYPSFGSFLTAGHGKTVEYEPGAVKEAAEEWLK